jgi:hypothetical protein
MSSGGYFVSKAWEDHRSKHGDHGLVDSWGKVAGLTKKKYIWMFPKIGVLHGTPTSSISTKIFHMHFVGFPFLGNPHILLDIQRVDLVGPVNQLTGPNGAYMARDTEFRQG